MFKPNFFVAGGGLWQLRTVPWAHSRPQNELTERKRRSLMVITSKPSHPLPLIPPPPPPPTAKKIKPPRRRITLAWIRPSALLFFLPSWFNRTQDIFFIQAVEVFVLFQVFLLFLFLCHLAFVALEEKKEAAWTIPQINYKCIFVCWSGFDDLFD